jgi:hypothetical protein
MVSTPPCVLCVNCGTASLRFMIAIVLRSSKPIVALGENSMRIRRSVSTVKRALPETTTAAGSATGS